MAVCADCGMRTSNSGAAASQVRSSGHAVSLSSVGFSVMLPQGRES